MSKPLIVVTGKNGQLGWEILQIAESVKDSLDFLFTGRDELDLSKPETIAPFFEKNNPDYFINCAAYTAVDKAEQENESAYKTNAESVGLIAQYCSKIHAKLITISTDYVFDGNGVAPYTTETKTSPINYYGYSKWMGEQLALSNCAETIVIRTSWVYSVHGNNFVKTMLRLMNDRPELNVVSDQIGSPTYAADLALTIIKIIESIELGHAHYGIYHYSNAGVISWFDFATSIAKEGGKNCIVHPIPSSAYPTPAKRPGYSVMDCSKLVKDYGIELKEWQNSLNTCIQLLVN
ncbi:MAG: dTDP-4-dehydrorhamnose reductase [Bacteroidota bacterium]